MKLLCYIIVLMLVAFQIIGQVSSTKITQLLDAHNILRREVNVQLLFWSNDLEADAKKWAIHLAKTNHFAHASLKERKGNGENLWRGTKGKFSIYDMVNIWGEEKKDYRYGKIKSGGKSSKKITGHYTQIVWKKTTKVGCALAENAQNDILVCRYSPAGNMVGEFPY